MVFNEDMQEFNAGIARLNARIHAYFYHGPLARGIDGDNGNITQLFQPFQLVDGLMQVRYLQGTTDTNVSSRLCNPHALETSLTSRHGPIHQVQRPHCGLDGTLTSVHTSVHSLRESAEAQMLLPTGLQPLPYHNRKGIPLRIAEILTAHLLPIMFVQMVSENRSDGTQCLPRHANVSSNNPFIY